MSVVINSHSSLQVKSVYLYEMFILASVSRPSPNSFTMRNLIGRQEKMESGDKKRMKTRKHGEGLGNNLS